MSGNVPDVGVAATPRQETTRYVRTGFNGVVSQIPSHATQVTRSGLAFRRHRSTLKKWRGSVIKATPSRNSIHPGDLNGVERSTESDDISHYAALSKITSEDFVLLQYEEDVENRLALLRRMTIPLTAKCFLKNRLDLHTVTESTCWKSAKKRSKLGWKKLKFSWRELGARLELWRQSFKTIEGHYGSAVASYFVFLKWLFYLNIYIFVLMFVFIVIPQIIFIAQGYDYTVIANSTEERVNLSRVCTSLYEDSIEVDSQDVGQILLDFLQGTGWMESTLLFEGFYSDRDLAIGTFGGTEYSYNLPLAYILVVIICIIVSLTLMVRHTAQGLRTKLVESDEQYFQYCNLAFGGWDYSMYDETSVILKHKMLYNEIKGLMLEEQHQREKHARSCCSQFWLFLLRVVVNLFVLGVLAGSGYLIFYATEQSTEFTQRSDYEDQDSFVKLLMEYIPSITITLLNVIVPQIFRLIVKLEDYSPLFEINITLTRTVVLRLASLAVLIGTLYTQITCDDKDECNVGVTPECPELRCWETYVGQQLYKLTIFDFFAVLFIIFVIDFPRALMVRCCGCKVIKVIGKAEFEVPRNVLDLVYSQTLCWLGLFFAPLIPAINVIKFFLLFYLKKLTTLLNYAPPSRPFRASKSHFFFMVVLMFAFLLCCVPLGYVLWKMQPSTGCGPFRVYDTMYQIVTQTIEGWPRVVQQIFQFMASPGFIVPAFVFLVIMIYYYHTAASANSDTVAMLRDQITFEGKDKQFLLRKVQELTDGGRSDCSRLRVAHVRSDGLTATP